jgi:hypothetical protein
MTSAERIDKYFADISALSSTRNDKKLSTEIDKLRSWMQKHQNESVPEASRSKLVQIIDLCHRYIGDSEVIESTQALISDYLALPEGKLASSKAKKKMLGWIEGASDTNEQSEELSFRKNYIVSEVNSDGSFNLIDDNGESLDNIACASSALKYSIIERFHDDDCVEVVAVNGSVIVDIVT